MRTDLKKRLQDNSDAPEARLGTLPKTFTSSKNRTKLHSISRGRMGTPGCVNKRAGGQEFVVDSGTRMRLVSKKDFNFAELETVRMSRNLSTVMTANGEVQTRKEATVHVKK